LRSAGLDKTVSVALRFWLSVAGVQTASVGTTKPWRWEQNARLLQAGPLSQEQFNEIRERWNEIAPRIWVGQT